MGPVDPVVQRPGHRMGTTTLLRGDVMNAASSDHDAPDFDNIAERLRLDKIETVICAVPDIWGPLVGKRVATESFLKTALGSEGLHGSLYLFVVDMDMDPRPGYAVSNWASGFSDFRLVPHAATPRALPWPPAPRRGHLPGAAVAAGDVYRLLGRLPEGRRRGGQGRAAHRLAAPDRGRGG